MFTISGVARALGRLSTALALLAGYLFLMPENGNAQSPWMADRNIASELREAGAHQETERAILYFESGTLSETEMSAFAALVETGIQDIAVLLGVPSPSRKIYYFVSSQFAISHSQGHSVYLPLERVANKSAPYLHETTHVLASCRGCPMWFSEGLASFVQSYVSEHKSGYDGIIFARNGNRGIDRDALRWLANERGQAVLPFIGTPEEPPQIDHDRTNVAAPFYVMAQSLVKYMVQNTDMDKISTVMGESDFDDALKRVTGKTAEQWKQDWLSSIRS